MEISYYPPLAKNAPVSSNLPIPIISFPVNMKQTYKGPGPVALLKPSFMRNKLANIVKNIPPLIHIKDIKDIKDIQRIPKLIHINDIRYGQAGQAVPIVQAVQAVQAVQEPQEPQEDIIIIKQHKSHKNKYKITITNKGYMCDLCGNIYKDLSYIQLHQKEHSYIETGIKKYKCDKCNHAYTFEKHLVSHQKKHK